MFRQPLLGIPVPHPNRLGLQDTYTHCETFMDLKSSLEYSNVVVEQPIGKTGAIISAWKESILVDVSVVNTCETAPRHLVLDDSYFHIRILCNNNTSVMLISTRGDPASVQSYRPRGIPSLLPIQSVMMIEKRPPWFVNGFYLDFTDRWLRMDHLWLSVKSWTGVGDTLFPEFIHR